MIADDVIKALDSNEGQYVIYDQVEENPSIEYSKKLQSTSTQTHI